MQKKIRTLAIVWLLAFTAHANNIQIGPVTILGTDTLQFTLSWENSWRVTNNPNNWDAVWVFVKRSDCATIQWHHANLSATDADHSAGSPLFVDAYTDKKGVMIYRSAPGAGNISNVIVKLKLDAPPPGNYQYKVFGIEMVYVPQGAFYAGDASTNATFKTGSTGNPYHMTGEDAFTISPNGTDLWGGAGFNAFTVVPAAFPKGYNAFYCMKYEISQGQYADFLNTIAPDAALSRHEPAYYNQNRYTISGVWPVYNATAPDRACNWMGFKDLVAYLDWSALSPMTELEFEKAARGGDANLPAIGELAWGSPFAADADSIAPGTDGTPFEAVDNYIVIGTKGLANYGNDSVLGPLRCGFAAKNATTKFEAGASFYGVMELSGNVFEMCYTLYNSPISQAANFNGSHGDGELTLLPPGYANQSWPAEAVYSDAVEYASIIPRGGAWQSTNVGELGISDRTYFVLSLLTPLDVNTGRNNGLGGRGVSRRQ